MDNIQFNPNNNNYINNSNNTTNNNNFQLPNSTQNDDFLLGNFYSDGSHEFVTPIVVNQDDNDNNNNNNNQSNNVNNKNKFDPQIKTPNITNAYDNSSFNTLATNSLENQDNLIQVDNFHQTNNSLQNNLPSVNQNISTNENYYPNNDLLLNSTSEFSTLFENRNSVNNKSDLQETKSLIQNNDTSPSVIFSKEISGEKSNQSYTNSINTQKASQNKLQHDKKTKFTNISELLDLIIQKQATDLHITAYYPPYIRIDDKLVPVGDPITPEESKNLITQVLTGNQLELLEVNKEIDLSFQHSSKDRFRINAFYQRGSVSAAFRLIPNKIKSISELNLPNTLLDIAKLSQGFFLVTGPTGSGKSTTLAAIIQFINENYPKHIITIEDPIEYIYPLGKALIDQRELGTDTHDWNIAMKSALRQDPDVILIGELRDFETIQLAITLAETGHLVFATLHTNSASQSIDRIIDVFPPHQQQQIRIQISSTLKGVLSQRLVPLIQGGRTAVVELLLVTNAVQNLIREGKTYQIDNIIATSTDLGMISMEKSIVKLVRQGKITVETALVYSARPDEVQKLLKSSVI